MIKNPNILNDYSASEQQICLEGVGALFQRCQVYDWPLLSAKSIWLVPVFWISIWSAPLFWYIPVHAHIFRSEIFRGYLFSWYSMNWLLYLSNRLPAINRYKKSIGSIWMGQHFRRSSIWMGPFFQRPGIWLGQVSKYWLEHPYHN